MEAASTDDFLDVSKLDLNGSFDDQVERLLQRVRLARAEVEGLELLVSDLETAFSNVWRGCEVHPFGSIITGLGIKSSDVDCYVQLPRTFIPKKSPVVIAKSTLAKLPWIFGELFSIPQAKVPILKFLHKPTNCHCDVNFKSPSGVRNSKLIGFLLNQDSRYLNLAILVKYWSKVYNLTGTNLMPNYALILMVIFYLQQRHLLPPVVHLQQNVDVCLVDDWNTAFDTYYQHQCFNNEMLYQLLGGFFTYYASFDYESNVICPFNGHPVNKQRFADFNALPDEYYLYKQNVGNRVCPELRTNTAITVQDPFELSRNCTAAVFPKLAEKIIDLFRYAAKMYEDVESSRFLGVMLTGRAQFHATPRSPPRIKHVAHNKVKKRITKKKQNFHDWFMQQKTTRRR